MATVELIGVPFDGYGRPGNQALAATALRSAGFEARFAGHDVASDTDLDLPEPDPRRDPASGIVNQPALLAMTDALNGRVVAALSDGRFPVVFGGDCTVLLGAVTALRDARGAAGLLVIDGHEETMPLDVSEDGEAANMEIGLLLGLTGTLASVALRQRLPAVDVAALALLGARDQAWRRRFNVGDLRDTGVRSVAIVQLAGNPAGAGAAAVRHIRAAVDGWWLHVDLDVLADDVFRAQGVPGDEGTPGGLGWPQLTALVTAAIGEGGCVGCSVVIYDPEQDPAGDDARRIVAFIGDIAAALH